MARTQTHFEQVPRAVVEKILAKQNLRVEVESRESANCEKSSILETKISTRPLSKS